MYENEIYSGTNAGNHTTGEFSTTQDTRDTVIGERERGYGTFAHGNSNDSSYANANSYTGSTADSNSYANTNRNADTNGNANTNSYTNGVYSSTAPVYGEKKAMPPKKQKQGGFFRKAMLSVSLGLFFGLFAGIGFYAVGQTSALVSNDGNTDIVSDGTNDGGSPSSQDSQSGISLANTSNVTVVDSDISKVVEEVMPAMVSIVNNYTATGQIFGQTYSQNQAASGSGIIVAESDTELLIVSNYHVVADATSLDVTFINGDTATAQIKGTDADMDLAVIAIQLSDLSQDTKEAISIATLGESNNLKLGEPVIAIGNALGYGQSVTNGIVSALDREVTMTNGSTGTFIQTNAAINPGNSGGALLNINGEVIGINSNKIGGEAVEGMGYAIPISSASPIIADLMERQTRTKVAEDEIGYIGITLQEVTAQVSQMYGMPQGIFINSIQKGGAADNAGLKEKDIITEFDGETITSYAELQDVLQYYAAGTTVEITVQRQENGVYREYQYELTLGRRDAAR